VDQLEQKALMAATIATSVVVWTPGPSDFGVNYEINSSGEVEYWTTLPGSSPTVISGLSDVIAITATQSSSVSALFAISGTASSNKVYEISYQTGGLYAGGAIGASWTAVSSNATDDASSISAVYAGGELNVLEVNSTDNTYYSSKGTGGWSSWMAVELADTDNSSQISAIALANGDLAIFRTNTSGGIDYDVDTDGNSDTGWSVGWSSVASGVSATTVSATNAGLTPFVFFTNSSGAVHAYYQASGTPTWSSEISLTGVTTDEIAVTTYYSSAAGAVLPVIQAVNTSGDLVQDAYTTDGFSGWSDTTYDGEDVTGVSQVAVAPLPNQTSVPNYWAYLAV
jgi:hypothetical protein